MGIRARKGSDRLRTIWTPEMDRYFIDLMLDQVGKENRIDDHLFSKRAWKHMMSLFNAKFKFPYEKDVLKNRHKTLRNLYRAIKNLLYQKGFSWDETRQMVTADNKVWDDYIKLHPDARSYRIKTIPYYRDLCEIYITAEGKGNLSGQNEDENDIVPGSKVVGLLEGPESVATPLDDEEPVDKLVESSTQSAGNPTEAVSQPSIVGETAVEALHDITIDEDYGLSVSKAIVEDAPQPAADMGSTMGMRTRTYWQPPMDRYFIDLMLDQVQKGNQIDGQFRKQAWMDMIACFNAKFGFKYDIDVLKNRYKTLRRQYHVIKTLLELDGFAWDDTRQMVSADDCVWQDYIKAHTDARQFMTRPVPYYKDLCLICRELSLDGRESLLGYYLDEQDEVPKEAKFIRALKGSHSPAASFCSEDQVGHRDLKITVAERKDKRQLVECLSSCTHSKKSRSEDQGMATALQEMATAVSSLADKRKDDENSNSNTIAIENVIEAIQSLPDMDEDLVLDACDLLEDEKKAKTFLALDVKLRKKWLIRKLRPQH